MRKRLMQAMGILACGCSFQLAGCQSGNIAEIVAGGLRDTTVAVATFAVEAVVDNALGLE